MDGTPPSYSGLEDVQSCHWKKKEEMSQLVRAEQKSVIWMKNIVSKISRASELVVELFSGTVSTAKA